MTEPISDVSDLELLQEVQVIESKVQTSEMTKVLCRPRIDLGSLYLLNNWMK